MALVFAFFAAYAETASAQPGSVSPPLSPWLLMTNRGGSASGFSNYHEFVRPRMEMERTMRTQGDLLTRTASATKKIEDQMSEDNALSAPKITGSQQSAAAFRNHAHWYRGISTDPTPRDQRKFR